MKNKMEEDELNYGYWGVDTEYTHGEPEVDIWFGGDDPSVGRRMLGPDLIISGTIENVINACKLGGDIYKYIENGGYSLNFEVFVDPSEEKLLSKEEINMIEKFNTDKSVCN